MRKKMISAVLAAAMVMTALTGCAKKVDPSTTGTTAATSAATEGTTAATTAGTTEASTEATSENKTSEPIQVSAWYTFANTNEANYLAAIEAFNASQDKYVVTGVSQAWNEINQKIMSALQAGTQPDIIAGDAAAASNYVKQDLLVDFMPYINDPEIGIKDFSDYVPAFIDECSQWDGQMFMFPCSRTGEVYYYNKTFFDENGLSVPKTWTELKEVNAKITEISGKQAFGFDYIDDSYIDMVIQKNGTYIDTANKKAGFDTQISLDAVNYMKDMVDAGTMRMKGEDKSLYIPMANELLYSFIGTSASVSSVISTVEDAFEVGYAPIPQEGDKEYVTMWGVNQMVFKSTEDKQKGAYEFLKFFTSTEWNAKWAIGYNALPIRQSAIDSAEYQAYVAESPVVGVLVEQTDKYGYQPAVTGSYETNNAITIALEEIMLEADTIENSIKDAQTEADTALNTAE